MECEKLFTIIVPIYNVERFLRQCLDSLLYQTLDNHIVIMINDGSTDNSGIIAKEYAEKFPELFRYFEQKNLGLGAARNAGLHYAETEMVGFLDSDDWVPRTYIERLTERVKKAKRLPDILYTLPAVFNCATNSFEDWADKPLLDTVFHNEEIIINPQYDARILGAEVSACMKIYRVSMLKQINYSFPEGTKWEDVEPHFKVHHAADYIIAEKNTGFIYRINSGAQITSSIGSSRLQIVPVFSRILKKAFDDNWTQTEILYIIKTMYSFTKWSLRSSTIAVRKQLVENLHPLYCSVPSRLIHQFHRFFRIGKKDILYIWLLRSPFYSLMGNQVRYDRDRVAITKLASRLKRILRR